MGITTPIAWCDATWNVLRGCSRIAAGCVRCYAERMAARNLPGHRSPTTGKPFATMSPRGPQWTGKVEFIESQLEIPLHWKLGRKIFVNSMSDTFHAKVQDEWLDRMFAVMALCPQHTFIVPTKRIGRAREYISSRPDSMEIYRLAMATHMHTGRKGRFGEGHKLPLPNVILLASIANQADADRDIPILLDTPAAVRGISLEPMIGPVDLRPWLTGWSGRNSGLPSPLSSALEQMPDLPRLDWVICGSESGPGARPCDLGWVRSVRDQCSDAGVAFFFKQWIEVGKKTELPFLDGRQWMQHPEVRHV